MTTTTEPTDVPENYEDPNRESVRPGVETRGPLDPLTSHLWRFKRPQRRALVEPFVGHQVKLERWFGRVAANGDQTYHGTILAIALTTIGSAADLVILKTVDGTVWAISTAQVAYLELTEKPAQKTPTKRTRAAAATGARTGVEETAKVTRRRRKAEPVEVPR